MSASVSLSDIVVRRGRQIAVSKADLEIEAGTWFGLIGANGSGKTSLLRAIGGRLSIADGDCRLGGRELSADRAARAGLVGFAPPVETLPGALRGGELLALVAGDRDAALARLGPLTSALGIVALLDRRVGGCSAGMKQRLAIAVAFVTAKPIVILDEPFNWLDPVAAFDLKQVLRALVADGLTLITALHDLATLATCCDAGAMLADGRVARALDAATLRQAARDPQGFERETIDLLRAGDRPAPER